MESQTALVSSSPTTGCLPASLALFKRERAGCVWTRRLVTFPQGWRAGQQVTAQTELELLSCFWGLPDFEKVGAGGVLSFQKSAVRGENCP